MGGCKNCCCCFALPNLWVVSYCLVIFDFRTSFEELFFELSSTFGLLTSREDGRVPYWRNLLANSSAHQLCSCKVGV